MNRIIPLLRIEKIALHGYGLGYAEDKAVFVPFTMPGDCVDVQVRLEKKDIIFANVIEYRESSEQGILPDCEAFGGEHACGGCDWLMAPYELQLKWKTELVRQVFEPLQSGIKVQPAVPSPKPRYYRNKSFIPSAGNGKNLYFGMYERYSHNVVPHKQCSLQPPVMDKILNEIELFAVKVHLESYNENTLKGVLRHVGIRVNRSGDKILVILVTRGSKFPFTKQLINALLSKFPQITGIVQNINRSPGNVILGSEDKLLFGSPYLEDELDGITLRVHYKSFFQVNSLTAEALLNHLENFLKPDDIVLDSFCGTGSIGLAIAKKVKKVIGVEEVLEAVLDAEYNAELNGIHNAEFHTGLVEEKIPTLMKANKFSVIILDPPRKGVEENTLDIIAEEKIPIIIYISCNPMTLARDVKLLKKKGYRIEGITPFDMFPQTWHIETVVKLSL